MFSFGLCYSTTVILLGRSHRLVCPISDMSLNGRAMPLPGSFVQAPPPDMTVHTISLETQVVGLDATKAFDGLTLKERQYALALARADWEGAKICLLQTSPESTPIFCLLQLVFAPQSVAELISSARTKGLSVDEAAKAMCWIAAFYGNVGNYKVARSSIPTPNPSPVPRCLRVAFTKPTFFSSCALRGIPTPRVLHS